MPRQQSITRENVLEAAFTLLRQEGEQSVSARNIAKKLGCSTQPVYSTFPSMATLEEELLLVAWQYLLEHYLIQPRETQSFYEMGLGYIRFGREERALFHYIFLSTKSSLSLMRDRLGAMKEPVIDAMRSDPMLADLPLERLEALHEQMWIFTHGITTVLYTDPDAISERQVTSLLDEVGMKVIGWELLELNEKLGDPPCDGHHPIEKE